MAAAQYGHVFLTALVLCCPTCWSKVHSPLRQYGTDANHSKHAIRVTRRDYRGGGHAADKDRHNFHEGGHGNHGSGVEIGTLNGQSTRRLQTPRQRNFTDCIIEINQTKYFCYPDAAFQFLDEDESGYVELSELSVDPDIIDTVFRNFYRHDKDMDNGLNESEFKNMVLDDMHQEMESIKEPSLCTNNPHSRRLLDTVESTVTFGTIPITSSHNETEHLPHLDTQGHRFGRVINIQIWDTFAKAYDDVNKKPKWGFSISGFWGRDYPVADIATVYGWTYSHLCQDAVVNFWKKHEETNKLEMLKKEERTSQVHYPNDSCLATFPMKKLPSWIAVAWLKDGLLGWTLHSMKLYKHAACCGADVDDTVCQLAQASGAAYHLTDGNSAANLSRRDLDLIGSAIKHTPTQTAAAGLWRSQSQDYCILSFKGTTDGEVLFFDDLLGLEEASYCGKDWSAGMVRQLRKHLDLIWNTENMSKNLGECDQLHVTGHSLGGAIASMFSWCWKYGDDNDEDKKNMLCHMKRHGRRLGSGCRFDPQVNGNSEDANDSQNDTLHAVIRISLCLLFMLTLV